MVFVDKRMRPEKESQSLIVKVGIERVVEIVCAWVAQQQTWSLLTIAEQKIANNQSTERGEREIGLERYLHRTDRCREGRLMLIYLIIISPCKNSYVNVDQATRLLCTTTLKVIYSNPADSAEKGKFYESTQANGRGV